MKLVVGQNKLRLDRFLAEKIKEASRSRIQKDIESGLVRVNGEVAAESKTVVRLGDEIEYRIQKTEYRNSDSGFEILDSHVLYENEDLLVIDKPAGLVVHPAPGYKGPTLVEGLLHKYKDIKLVGEDDIRPGIVHRLDKDTSGVMLVAKSQKMFEHLKDAFASRKIKKEYIALVCGNVESKHGFIDAPVGKHAADFRKMTALRPTNAKPALTEYYVQEHLDGYTLLMVKLHTGRTHQIRVHFSSPDFFGGHPLAGDKLYGKCKAPGLERQFLHARKIEVQLPDATWIEAESKLPPDLEQVLNNLRK